MPAQGAKSAELVNQLNSIYCLGVLIAANLTGGLAESWEGIRRGLDGSGRRRIPQRIDSPVSRFFRPPGQAEMLGGRDASFPSSEWEVVR